MIIAIAAVRVHPDKVERYEAACRELMPRARAANSGVQFYHVGKCREEEFLYQVVEAYSDQASMDHHIADASLRKIIEPMMDCVAEIEIKLHDSLD